MATLTFKGGIHPYDGKELTKDKPIRNVLPKGDLVYPMQQHIGAPAKPVVAKGDKVKVTLRFRGREMAHMGASKHILDDFAENLKDIASVEKPPKLEGKSMSLVLAKNIK